MLKPVRGLTGVLALLVSHRSQIELMLINFTGFYSVHELPPFQGMLPVFALSGADIQTV